MLPPRLLSVQAGGQNLDRDGATEREIFGGVDLSHPAGADQSDDPVMPEGAAHHVGAPFYS